MFHFRAAWTCVVFAFGLVGSLGRVTAGGERLKLSPEQAIDVSGESVARRLLDEQELAGDPRKDRAGAGKPKTEWTLGWTNWETIHPIEAVIDLGRVTRLDGIGWFDGPGQQELVVTVWKEPQQKGKPGTWMEIVRDPLSGLDAWTLHDLDLETRYVRFLQAKPGGAIREVVLYGTPADRETEATTPPAAPASKAGPKMDRFMGVNGFHTSPLDRVASVAGVMREYHQWQWDEGNQDPAYRGGRPAWNPSWVSGPGWGWNFDEFYSRAARAGIEVQPVTQGTLPYLIDGQKGEGESHPIPADRMTESPESYREHSAYLHQFALRYGQTRVKESRLRLREGQEKRSGLGLINVIENWNEPDKTWRTRSARFRPWELAAMCSADYDGHQGTMGVGYGIKGADPSMEMLSGGLFKLNVDYLRAMKLWSDLHRNGKFPADGVAVHHYCRTRESLQEGEAESPESHGLLEKLRSVVAWRDREAPGLSLWFGEFGYDTHPKSPVAAAAFPGQTREQTQGLWLVRTYLIAALAGVDRAQMYMLADVNPESATQFDTSGLLESEKKGFQPKPSFYHVATLRQMLRSTRLVEHLHPDRKDLYVLRFEDSEKTAQSTWVIWTEERHATSKPSVTLSLPGVTVTRTTLADDREQGLSVAEPIQNGSVTITATPSPVFLTVEQ